MFAKNHIIGVGLGLIFWLLLSGCGLFGGRSGLVGQGVAFPQPADGPPTSEGALPRPIILSATTPDPEAATEPAPPSPAETAVPSPPTNPPANPLPTATTPRILSFTADITNAAQGKTITFIWESTGGSAARLYNWANGSSRFPAFWDIPPSGSITVNLTGTRRSDPYFELFVYAGEAGDAAIPNDTRSLQIPWDCSLAYFFQPGSDICPHTLPAYTTAAVQQFQGGRMLWLEALDWIYVLYDEVYPGGGQGGDLQWERFDDHWTEANAEIERLLQPPAGLYAPVGRFSLIWQDNPAVQQRLGWAVSQETVYDGAWQLQPSDTDYPGDGAIFILLAEGQVARLSGFDTWGWLWSAITPVNE